jgi:putative colanic acid biosynthesis UDP-glucose lipid carrier transferase
MLPRGLLKEYSRALSLALRGMDMLAVLAAGLFAYFIRFATLSMPSFYEAALLAGFVLTPMVLSFSHIYTSVRAQGFLKHSFTLIQAMCLLGGMLSGLSFFTKSGEIFSRTWFLMWMVLAIVLLILLRCSLLFFLRFMRTHGWNERVVVIFGAGELGVQFASTVQQALWTGFRIIAFIDDHPETKPEVVHGIPVVKTPEHLIEYLLDKKVDELWIALPLREEIRVKEILHALRHHTITTRFVLDIFGLDLLNHSIADVAGFPVLNIHSTPMVGMNRLVKAIEDRVLAAMILILISPLLLIIALGVKLSSKGPVFFKQQRLGWDGRVIKVYKFRTMVQHIEAEGVVSQATARDKRVTPFGRFLRRTSLDELPQFINVLQGRMSIVGPRPHALAHHEIYKNAIHTYMHRHRVKPGITGWAQVNGWRGETDTLSKMQKRVEYDLFYINNWSLGFDLKIMMLTFLHGFINRNAY